MRASFPDWPKLLGGVVGLEAFGLVLWQAEHIAHGYIDIYGFWLAFAILIFGFSLGLYCAQNWARWCVIAFGTIVGIGLIVITGTTVADNWARRSEFAPRATLRELRVDDLLQAFHYVGVGLCFLAPVALVVCVLCHRDVAAAFHRKKVERSNQALQRTAPRSDA